jgi:hypothetical protein
VACKTWCREAISEKKCVLVGRRQCIYMERVPWCSSTETLWCPRHGREGWEMCESPDGGRRVWTKQYDEVMETVERQYTRIYESEHRVPSVLFS